MQFFSIPQQTTSYIIQSSSLSQTPIMCLYLRHFKTQIAKHTTADSPPPFKLK